MRFKELDALRGFAVLAMIIFHTFYDLDFTGALDIDLSSGFWWFFPRAIASLFIFVAGVSLSLSYSSGRKDPMHYFIRGAKLFGIGLVITCVTYIFVPYAYIRFGILHFIGIATILSFPFLKRSSLLNIILGMLSIIAGFWLKEVYVTYPYLLWLGIKPYSFYTLDYFPIFPWFGAILFGIAAGNFFYPQHKRRWDIKGKETDALRFPAIIGSHSLLIYLLHQPVLLSLILLFEKVI